MAETSFYEKLGVLPSAPDFVIRAAYKALAQRYHPDHVAEPDRAGAHERMVEINEAYQVLADPMKRRAYDEQLKQASSPGAFRDEEQASRGDTFDAAMAEMAEDWKLACEIYPEIVSVRDRLQWINSSLAFTFMVVMLHQKQFDQAARVGQLLEQEFMQRYFGSDPEILQYALTLVLQGERQAALELNKVVSVVGSNADPTRVIAHVEKKFGLQERARKAAERKEDADRRKAELDALRLAVAGSGSYSACLRLAKALGYDVSKFDGGILKDPKIRVARNDRQREFKNEQTFCYWVRSYVMRGEESL